MSTSAIQAWVAIVGALLTALLGLLRYFNYKSKRRYSGKGRRSGRCQAWPEPHLRWAVWPPSPLRGSLEIDDDEGCLAKRGVVA